MESQLSHRALLWANRKSVLKGALCLVLVDLLVFSLPWMIKMMIDRLQGRELAAWVPSFYRELSPFAFVIGLCCLYLAVNAVIAVVRYWWRVHLIWATFPLFHRIRRDFFRHIQNLDREFFKTQKVGDLISALTTDTENMRMTLSIGALMLIDALINFLLFPMILWQLSPSLTLGVVPALLGISLLTLILSNRLSREYEKVQEITGDLSGRAFEIASGIRVIKAFRREKPVHDEFIERSRDLRDASTRVARYQSFFSPVLDYSLTLGLFVVLLFGGLQVLRGEMALSNLVAFQLYLGHMDWPMNAIGWFIQLFRSSQASQTRVKKFALAQNPMRVSAEEDSRSTENLFELDNIDFSYAGQRKFSFRGLTSVFKHGGWVGLTGPVGCGKSTFLELLSRQRDPTSGAIYFQGRNLKSFAPREIAGHILYVPQEAFMFSRSLRKNLALDSHSKLSDDALWSLLQDLSFDEKTLSERGGLNIKLGERGVNMSGGQRQRISLGRALVRSREVYLLDDLFSHVDTETESLLLRALRKRIPASATVILVSQRLETLRQCREVLVLDERGLEFQGSLEKALASSSFIQRLEFLQRPQMERVG